MPVYKRNRKETATQYVVTAQQLQKVTIQYLMNEIRVPKKWRFVLAQEAIHTVCGILNNVIGAHNTFPNTQERLEERKKYLQRAYIGCYQLQNQLMCMINVIQTVTVGNLGEITGLLLDEIELLSKTIKNSHVVGGKEV